MQWWCVAQSRPWDWTWQAYPGVWAFVLGLWAAYVYALRRVAPSGPALPGIPGGNAHGAPARDRPARRTAHRRWFGSGVLCLWVALDWPVGELGASYLVSVHMIQFLLIGMIAPALLLLGTPIEVYERLPGFPRLYRTVRAVTHPMAAFFVFNVGMTVTHWPEVTDVLMASQLGSFTLDMTWLACGLVLWWPLIAPVPDRTTFHPLIRVLYLAVNAVIIRPPFLMMIFSRYPIYATYELAPPIPGTDPLADQQLAGGLMKVGGAWILVFALVIVFFGWVRDSRQAERVLEASGA